MTNTKSSNGAISVMRFPDNGTSLVETWVLEAFSWEDTFLDFVADEDDVDISVQCYVCDVAECPGKGTSTVAPNKKVSVSDNISLSDAPSEVREEFIDEIESIARLGSLIEEEDP